MVAAGCGPATPVLFPCAQDARDELPQALLAAGIPVTRLVLYRSERIPEAELLALPRGEFDYAVFTSPSGAEAFFALRERPRFLRAVALGRTTANTLERHGVLRPCLPATPTTNDLIEAMCQP
jgi:uroporphyrinogen-III synthase